MIHIQVCGQVYELEIKLKFSLIFDIYIYTHKESVFKINLTSLKFKKENGMNLVNIHMQN